MKKVGKAKHGKTSQGVGNIKGATESGIPKVGRGASMVTGPKHKGASKGGRSYGI